MAVGMELEGGAHSRDVRARAGGGCRAVRAPWALPPHKRPRWLRALFIFMALMMRMVPTMMPTMPTARPRAHTRVSVLSEAGSGTWGSAER